jgi:hypothetical protein
MLGREMKGMSDPNSLEPSEAEIEEWAAAERKRREAWVSGPTDEQKTVWARRERERRLAQRTEAGGGEFEPTRVAQRYVRETQLATEGAFNLVRKWSLRGWDLLVRAGREWEEEFAPPSRRRSGREQELERPIRRRVPLEDDGPPG